MVEGAFFRGVGAPGGKPAGGLGGPGQEVFWAGGNPGFPGPPATVVGGGIATVAVVGVWWLGFPALRKVDRFEDLGG